MIKTRFRLGTNELMLDRGRRMKLAPNQRKCPCCHSNAIETPFHFTMECPAYNNQRRAFFKAIQKATSSSNTDHFLWNSKSKEEQFALLMANGISKNDASYPQWRQIETAHFIFNTAAVQHRAKLIRSLCDSGELDFNPADLLSDRWGSIAK